MFTRTWYASVASAVCGARARQAFGQRLALARPGLAALPVLPIRPTTAAVSCRACLCLQIIGEWCDPLLGPGREEHFQGTLLQYFPLHCAAPGESDLF